jgi:hypothetical protein
MAAIRALKSAMSSAGVSPSRYWYHSIVVFRSACPRKCWTYSNLPVFSYTSERNLLEGLVVPETPVASLFDFGEERVETLAPGVFVFGQSGLEQTPEAKFAAHTKRAATVRALVRLVSGKRISEEIHLREVKSSGCVEIDNCNGASGGDP